MLPVINPLKRDQMSNRGNDTNSSTIDVFPNFWVQVDIIGRNGYDRYCDIRFVYSSSFSTSYVYFKGF